MKRLLMVGAVVAALLEVFGVSASFSLIALSLALAFASFAL
jgi:hypothetical protein